MRDIGDVLGKVRGQLHLLSIVMAAPDHGSRLLGSKSII
jgi:hypothetical protein